MHVQQIISTHPQARGKVNDAIIRCVEECYDCAQSCTACADACLGEQNTKELLQCIRLNLDCADICSAAGAVATRRTGNDEEVVARLLEVCARICRTCGDECAMHAKHYKHCEVCAEACDRCEKACQEAVQSLARRVQ